MGEVFGTANYALDTGLFRSRPQPGRFRVGLSHDAGKSILTNINP